MMMQSWCGVLLVLAAGLPHGTLARPLLSGITGPNTTRIYEGLTPLANVVDIQGVWKALNLPQLPETFCHVGLVGWHCHNTTMHPWNPASIFPKDETPPMPANATCVICPQGWTGARKNVVDVLLDLPIVQRAGKLPQGFYSMSELEAVAQEAADEAAATTAAAAAVSSSVGLSAVATGTSGVPVVKPASVAKKP